MSKSIDERIKYLETCANLYETSGNSPLTDDEYDKEYAECKKIVPNHPFFSKVGGIDAEHVYGTEVKHKYIMGSLNKDPNPEEFGEWFRKTYTDTTGVVAILQLKVDGSSFCLKYQDGHLIQAVTRGNGEKGFDFTPNALHIKGVNKTISAKGYVEVKGEVYKNRQDFYKNWADKYENPRNFTAGSINQKDPLVTKSRGLSFVAYDVRSVEFKTESDKLKFLISNGFENLREYTVKIDCSGRKVEEVVRAIQKYMGKFDRDKLPFDVDGIVFKLDDLKSAEDMGTTDGGKRPKSNRAVKFPTDQQKTVLEGIEWSVGRTGTVTPVGLLKPVRIAGTTVARVSIHNIKELGRLGIANLGGMVLVEKAGDIIPKIVKKISDGNKKMNIPDECPCCGETLEWDDTHTNKVCNNESCPAQLDRSIEHWFKKLDVKGIGPGIISKLTSECRNSYDDYMVKSIADMYNLKHFTSELSEVFGDRAFQNILESIDSVREVTLAKFIEALGIGKIGTMASEITEVAPTVDDVDKLVESDLVKISGFGGIKAKNFVSGWKAMRKEIDRILKYITIKKSVKSSDKLGGKSFCITGTLSQPRDFFQKMISDNGGKVSSSVSSKLDYLICGDEAGSKKEKAEKLSVKVISEKDFLYMLV